MSTFARTYLLALDGEEVQVTTRPSDFLGAERDMAREKVDNASKTEPMHLQVRIVWRAWRRTYPDGVRLDFSKFLDALEEMTDLDAEVEPASEPLTPTLPADMESLP